jgi:hypothetical protein
MDGMEISNADTLVERLYHETFHDGTKEVACSADAKDTMRLRLSVPILLLALLGGCASTGCGAALATDPSACALLSEPSYTDHAAQPGKTEIVSIRLQSDFTSYERAKILRAINEWNQVLNGHVRFDISPPSQQRPANLWMIAKAEGSRAASSRGEEALAVTQPTGSNGGLMIVFADRVGTRDLGGIVLHELGHVLGLGHDPRGKLMSTHYNGDNQRCVDKAAVQALAAARNWPLSDLNWCGAPNTTANGG